VPYDITRKSARKDLKPRREPYWLRLGKGAHLGFRRGAETWIAKYRGRDGKRQYKPLTSAVEYDEAKKAAEEWLSQLAGSGVRVAKRDTVRAALEKYLVDLRRHRRADAADETEGRFELTVYHDDVANLSLEEATRDDFLEWRDRLTKGRQARSVNRHVRAVVAGLNRAHELGHVGNPAAWRLRALADDIEDEGDTAVFLDASQRKAIIEAASSNLGAFLHGLELTGARPKELAATTAGDFDGEQLRLTHRKGRPPKLRVRYVVLNAEGRAFFAAQSRSKLPGALLFTEDGETPWRRHVWAREFRAAVAKVNEAARGKGRIPVENKEGGNKGASAYSFRHARISELLQLHGIDPLVVAQQTGTSVAMIERAYLKFIPSAMREKLAAVKEASR
jgi:integrase